jgi:oxygen-independent coproporphyrinogen-3 oxidase
MGVHVLGRADNTAMLRLGQIFSPTWRKFCRIHFQFVSPCFDGILASVSVSPITSLYVHVPFCAHKCEYCAFFSEASSGELINRYVAALVRELELVATDLKPRTVFFGGGTPSILNLRQWETVLRAMGRLHLLGATEWTIESNPATVSLDKAKLWRDFGVNRVSMGVQSLDEGLLERLGRIHSREQVFKSFDTLRAAGFDNLNIDLMFAIPTQTIETWRSTLREAMALGSEHLSSYEVIYEEDTPLYAQLKAGEFDVDEELACAMFDELIRVAGENGLVQYEIANFARRSRILNGSAFDNRHSSFLIPALACQHNVNYWHGGSFYGLGPSATGYVRGVRTKNWSNTQMYCEQLEKGKRAIESSEQLSPEARAGEIAAFGLRMNAGWGFDEFRAVTGFDLREGWAEEMRQFIAQGWADADERGFRLNARGLRFADTVAEAFLRIPCGA